MATLVILDDADPFRDVPCDTSILAEAIAIVAKQQNDHLHRITDLDSYADEFDDQGEQVWAGTPTEAREELRALCRPPSP